MDPLYLYGVVLMVLLIAWRTQDYVRSKRRIPSDQHMARHVSGLLLAVDPRYRDERPEEYSELVKGLCAWSSTVGFFSFTVLGTPAAKCLVTNHKLDPDSAERYQHFMVLTLIWEPEADTMRPTLLGLHPNLEPISVDPPETGSRLSPELLEAMLVEHKRLYILQTAPQMQSGEIPYPTP